MTNRYITLAGYNAWANARIYDAASALSDADYRADRGAFFKSVHGTLNHLLVADRIWMHRFTGDGPLPRRLDEILCEDLAALRAARAAEDSRIADYAAALSDAALAAPLRYRNVAGTIEVSQPLASVLDHFFNHQTHHRGQLHALLTGLRGHDGAPSLDLITFQREYGLSQVTKVG
jgi:uncharacterized damage-inducible protein DinB